MIRDFSDFTLKAYADVLDLAAARYRFIGFGDQSNHNGCALWRHDIDFSPHRALAMAQLESRRGLRATYFVQLTSPFYNAMDSEIIIRLRRVAALGHDLGLHFEPVGDAPEDRLVFEARTLEATLGVPVRAFSLHNPTTYDRTSFVAENVAGLINASAPAWHRDYSYCSDSNGFWRFRSLIEVIKDPESKNIYALTHPEWWQDIAMPPRDRIRRCIEGRASYCSRSYDALLQENGRQNITANNPLNSI
jgi:hypothetical protein